MKLFLLSIVVILTSAVAVFGQGGDGPQAQQDAQAVGMDSWYTWRDCEITVAVDDPDVEDTCAALNTAIQAVNKSSQAALDLKEDAELEYDSAVSDLNGYRPMWAEDAAAGDTDLASGNYEYYINDDEAAANVFWAAASLHYAQALVHAAECKVYVSGNRTELQSIKTQILSLQN